MTNLADKTAHISSAWVLSIFYCCCVHVELFAFPVETFVGADQGYKVGIDAGAHVYPVGPIDAQYDSSPVIVKDKEAQWCYSAQFSPLFNALCDA